MLIEVTQDDITLGQANNPGLARGVSCPIARAVARTLGLPIGRVYAASRAVEVRWVPFNESADNFYNFQREFYSLDTKGENFIAQADNSDGHGCSGSDSPKPTTLVLKQTPLHCPVYP